MQQLIFLIIILSAAVSRCGTVIFQGTCADPSVLCEQLCIATALETYECSCWNDHVLLEDGIGCVVNISKPKFYFTNDVKSDSKRLNPNAASAKEIYEGNPLHFDGNSYVQLPSSESVYLEINITIVFRFSAVSDGILLYAGQKEGKDFISIVFKGSNIVLRLNCGEGTIDDLYGGPIVPHKWHKLIVRRKFCTRSEISMDDKYSMVDEIYEFKNYMGITIDDGIFIGGVPKDRNKQLLERVSTTQGFTGCIQQIVINGDVLFDAKTSADFRIGSPTGTDESILRGPSHITIPAFHRNSSVKLQSPNDIDEYLELKFELNLKESDGLIYFHGTKKQYFAVEVEKMFLYVHFSLAADVVILRSPQKLSLNRWHLIEIWRSGASSLLKIAGQPWMENEIINSIQPISKTESIYFGLASSSLLPTNLLHRISLSGCLKNIRLNGRQIHFIENADLLGITECGWEPCSSVQCGKHSACTRDHYVPTCLCQYPSYGPLCKDEHATSISTMNFGRFSYVHISDPLIMERITGEYMDLGLTIKLQQERLFLEEKDQVLALAQNDYDLGDYFRLLLTEEVKVTLLIDLGSGSLSLAHSSELAYDKWHHISVLRHGRNVSLTVENMTITANTPGISTELNVYDSFFIGGGKKFELYTSFIGCIKDVKLGPKVISLPRNETQAINIAPCSH